MALGGNLHLAAVHGRCFVVATDGFGRTLGAGSSTRVAGCGAVFLGDRGVWNDRIGGVSGQKARSAVQPHVC